MEYLKKTECVFTEYTDLSSASSIKIGAVARAVIYPDKTEKLIDVLKVIKKISLPYIVLGNMSNILFKDEIYNGVVVKTQKIKRKYLAEDKIKLECGCTLPAMARQISEYDLGGFEGLLGIPGTVGGMIRQNAGAFGYEISDRCISCSVYDTERDEVLEISRENMGFGYRTSMLNDKRFILLSASLAPIPKPRAHIIEEFNAYVALRRQAQPTNRPSLGSVFKRVNGIGAGYYIDKLGLKGFLVGGAQVSTKHAGFIVNTGFATAKDVLALIDIIKSRAYNELGIALEEEIEII